eukprot:TRINITY_DN9749_c0_g1_i1.p1 TRINITY_DN9749_c0_g1~~TRINITY_DN9749_c0_g1_i1.p1  ORF type:complete len:154 (-),score=34.44 TRINITY_DN9749_c0_g1_i1:64-471(-)
MSSEHKVVCRLRAVRMGKDGEIFGNVRELEQRGAIVVLGKQDFNNDECLLTHHVRVRLDEQRPVLSVELLAPGPALFWRNGQTDALALTPGTPIELSNGDRFSLLRNFHTQQVLIGPKSALNKVTSKPVEQDGFL